MKACDRSGFAEAAEHKPSRSPSKSPVGCFASTPKEISRFGSSRCLRGALEHCCLTGTFDPKDGLDVD